MTPVYLDSNILILGPKKEEHVALKCLARSGKIMLYISDHCNVELHGKVLPLLEEKNLALNLYDKLLPTGNAKIDQVVLDYINKKRDEYDNARADEEVEKSFWKDTGLWPVKSVFAGLWAVGALNSWSNSFIEKDLKKVDALMAAGVKGVDALHLVQAHCGRMEYFLTWDKPLINKARDISWLELRVMTPKDFISNYKN